MSNTLPGFIIAGYFGTSADPKSICTIAILASSEEEALAAAKESASGFTPMGAITEEQLRNDLKSIGRVASPGEMGFMIAGYTGEKLTPDSALKIPVGAENPHDAILKAIDIRKDFHIVGVISEEQMEIDLENIIKLRH